MHSMSFGSSTFEYTNASNISHCLCEPGFQSIDESCVHCAIGFHKYELANVSCQGCLPNSETAGTGSNHVDDCLCQPGFSKTDPNNHDEECQPCIAGSFKTVPKLGFVNSCGGIGGDSASGEVPHGLGGDVPSRAKEEQDQEVCHPASAAARSCVHAFPRVRFLPPCTPRSALLVRRRRRHAISARSDALRRAYHAPSTAGGSGPQGCRRADFYRVLSPHVSGPCVQAAPRPR